MQELFFRIVALSAQCAAVCPQRSALSRQTWLRRQLARINLPLLSVVHRVRRRLVLCGEAEFYQHMRAVLERFRCDVVALTQGLLGKCPPSEPLRLLAKAAIVACET
jgi:hypothetical protein